MIFSTLACATKSCASASAKQIKTLVKNPRFGMVMMLLFVFTIGVFAQDAAGNFSAGTKALTKATEEIAKYVPIVVKLCYAIAGVVAVVGAITVYIAMNNEENDIKNILVLRNAFEKTRNQMKVNALSINTLGDNLNFPTFAKLTLKKT